MNAFHIEAQPVARPATRGILGNTAWSALDFWTQQAAALLVFIMVGNLVGPAAVGVVTVAQLFVTLAMTLLIDGFSDALVQRPVMEARHFDAAFTLLLGLGLTAALVLVLAAPLIAALFGMPDLTRTLRLLALSLPLIGAGAAWQALLQRALRFRSLALRSLVAQAAGLGTGIALAAAGEGVLSLVGAFLAARGVDAVLCAVLARRAPGLAADRAAFADILGFGRHRVGNQIVGFVVMQVDRFSAGLF
ncbi:MAG TPA: oligosaccharide flippase family protein, partial [Crenalkalicoccus sp.]|nr:oligosaccharide flippase family protein [Crenalkalicoccus sp.]